MRFAWTVLAVVACLLATHGRAQAIVHAGDPAPNFTKFDTGGNSHTLSDYLGKVVVLNLLGHT